jgi:formylglycine-generating enzyme required for sulfatase activity
MSMPRSRSSGSSPPDLVVIPADPAFRLGRFPVTRAEYARFTGSPVPEVLACHPVVDVTWGAARAYCEWLSAHTGLTVRLPTSAEWVFAARGPEGRIWPWGDSFEPDRCNSVEAGYGTPTAVDAWPEGAGPFGTLDQAGNVWEWCADLVDGDWRVIHGGSWLDTDWGVRAERRLSADPNRATPNVGFRVAVDGAG